MEEFNLTSLTAANLPVNKAHSLFETSIEVSNPMKSYLGPIENAALAKFITDNDNFGKQINKNQKSLLTKQLKASDKLSIGFWREIKNITSTYINSSNGGKKEAAIAMDQFLKPYWDTEDLLYNSREGVFKEIVVKYKANRTLNAAATQLEIANLFESLESQNTVSDTIYKSRNDEYAAHEASGSSLKPAAVASYNRYCTAIVQAANLTPSPEIISLLHKLNELRKKYHALGGNGKATPPPDNTPTK